jgi:sterol 3beta-glucosyltransferase
VIDDPEKLTNILIDAVRACGTRAIISRGWSKLGSGLDEGAYPDIFFLGGCPHGKICMLTISMT